MTVRQPASGGGHAPCLFLVAHGQHPTSPPLRLRLDRHAEVGFRRGDALDVAPRRGEPAFDLAIPDGKVSAEHARLELCLGRWCVKDERSKNGTFVNGERVGQAVLADGDTIDVGDTIFVFRDAVARTGELAYQPAARRGLTSLLPDLQAELDVLARMAGSPITILVEGETGTGKEVVARSVHDLSGRAGELVPVNCGALPSERAEAELFGWRRGAFSGATADHAGLVRAADRGTLFLDEIGDLRLGDQASLLRILQEREVLPIGGTRPIAVDLRVVAATHRPLDAMASAGAFRADLLARLSGYRLRLLPLRRRREDLGLFLADVLQRCAGDGCRVTIGALRALLRHDWPTNIRGLEQTITRALVTCPQGVIGAEDLPGLGDAVPAQRAPEPAADDPRRDRLLELLREHRGNVAAVARAMGKARMQVQRWIKRYRLVPDEFRG
ncbi:MAG TPA: sigma 54-interacting transcriptional regulator [Kofleriaceae bacterium]|nr:sigma 54-interacting transcriptional regulator [Kofleriaceae bacterium]